MSLQKQLRKILYVGMRYDYGRPEQGTSFEYNNLYQTLTNRFHEVIEFDFMTIMQRYGKDKMNELLRERALQVQPDLIFFVLFMDEIERNTIEFLSERFVTFNWFCDDHWRFNQYSKHYAPAFTFVSTTDYAALDKYKSIGYERALLTQWACNHYTYTKFADAVKTYNVSFVGQPHGTRKKVIASLEHSGIPVDAFGKGWKNGRVTQNQMVRIFNGTKVNLNLSNSSWNIRTIFRNQQQIKGRNFEIPGCGSLLLTNYVERLERYYTIDHEIVCFRSIRELEKLIRYYLTHEQQREEIAFRGYQRTITEHTYEQRFNDLFKQMNFQL